MKKRIGFVSNSSSASFVVSKNRLTYIEQCSLLNYTNPHNEWWNIHEDENSIKGYTTMDNGDLKEFLKKQGMLDAVHIIHD